VQRQRIHGGVYRNRLTPSAAAARAIRIAISPRLAIRTFEHLFYLVSGAQRLQHRQNLPGDTEVAERGNHRSFAPVDAVTRVRRWTMPSASAVQHHYRQRILPTSKFRPMPRREPVVRIALHAEREHLARRLEHTGHPR
jgi:hypothetical protein